MYSILISPSNEMIYLKKKKRQPSSKASYCQAKIQNRLHALLVQHMHTQAHIQQTPNIYIPNQPLAAFPYVSAFPNMHKRNI